MTEDCLSSPADPAALRAEIVRLERVIDVQAAAARAECDRLTFELGHRVRNVLGVVQALASQTLRHAASPQDAVNALNHRVQALARANDAILREGWTTTEIGAVARCVLEAPGADHGSLAIAGPDLRIAASTALSLAIALHELASNARRHGAWTVPEGRVALDWTIEDDPAGQRLIVTWQEDGGPAAEAPAKRGLGLRLAEQSLKSAFGHAATLRFAPRGFSCRVDAALADMQPVP